MALAAGVFTLTVHGGVRSPDGEIVFRTAQALASRGTFAVEERLEAWPSFGLAPGRNGKLYSVFGPLESVLLVPFVALGDALAATGRYDDREVPISHYLDRGWYSALRGERPTNPASHAARWPAAWFNVLVSALCVWVFYRLAYLLTRHAPVSLSLAALLAFGTPLWIYSGTFFSEPLAVLLLLLSLLHLIQPYESADRADSARLRALASGLFLGLAVLTHITAVLFAPFFAWYLVRAARDTPGGPARIGRPLGSWLGGLGVGLALLGIYNFARFGSLTETGRGVDPMLAVENGYGTFVAPGVGLVGLLFSPGKGLFLYAPIVVLGLVVWPRFHRRHRHLSWMLASAALFRLLVIASRSDWHGGFSLGPRLLLVLVPFLILPLGSWLTDQVERGNRRRLRLFSWLVFALVIQQLYFALGDAFSFLHLQRFRAQAEGRSFDVVFDWANSPLLNSLDRGAGPFLLKPIPLSPELVWLAGAALVGVAVFFWSGRLLVRRDG